MGDVLQQCARKVTTQRHAASCFLRLLFGAAVDGADGRLLVHCHAGCDTRDVLEELRRHGLVSERDASRYNGSTSAFCAKQIKSTHDYPDEQGRLLYQAVRFEPKDFRLRRPDGNGGWIWNIDGVRRVTYRLPDLIEAVANRHVILIVEGEKDVDAVRAIGIPATCNAGGAGKWRDEFATYFAGADVVVIPDNDNPGRRHAECVAASLHKTAARVRLLELPDLPPKGDISDWLASGGTAERLWALIETAPDYAWWSAGQPQDKPGRSLIVRRASDVVPEKIEWVWRGRIARGKHTTIAGDPGTGKSQLAIAIVAVVTTESYWPCGEGRAPLGEVVILSAEDGISDTIVPRLIAAGADLNRVHIVTATQVEDGKGHRTFNLQADLDLVEQKIREIGNVVLVIVDPVSAYMVGVDSHKNAEVRRALAPLGEMAERRHAAIVSVTHFTKGGTGTPTKALYRFIGSIAFTAAPRAAFVVMEDPGDPGRRLFLHGKNNLGPATPGLAFRLEQRLIGENKDILASSVAWDSEPVDTTADEVLGVDNKEETTATDAVSEFLLTVLDPAPLKVLELEIEARAAGYLGEQERISKNKTFRIAKAKLGIKSFQPKGQKAGGWFWALPKHQAPSGVSGALWQERAPDENRAPDSP